MFLLNNKVYGMGFPSQIADAPILQLLLDNCDHFPFAEERRLFYVAITRAKKKVWLVTRKGNESVFVEEINSVCGEAMRREQYTCPLCGGRLVRRSGPYGDFYGCSAFKTTKRRYKRSMGAQLRFFAPHQVYPFRLLFAYFGDCGKYYFCKNTKQRKFLYESNRNRAPH